MPPFCPHELFLEPQQCVPAAVCRCGLFFECRMLQQSPYSFWLWMMRRGSRFAWSRVAAVVVSQFASAYMCGYAFACRRLLHEAARCALCGGECDGSWRPLPRFPCADRSVRCAWRADNVLGAEGARHLAAPLGHLTALTSLELRGVCLPPFVVVGCPSFVACCSGRHFPCCFG